MSIKFKQNGQWVKIPTPSQIDDSAASAATTYSSNKINEIIPQGIAKYLLEHKDELGTDDFTKLKNVPFTTINTTNKSEFTTLKGILDHPDGMYLVDDCGITNGDEQLTIASFKGHCSTMLMASIAQFQEIVDSDEIRCYKGSVIYILTEGNISNGATRYVTVCNVPMGVSGGSVAPDGASSDAGTSVVNIEVHPVEDRSSGTVTYSYDIDGGTQTLFTQPQYVSMFTLYTNALVSGGMITGKSSYSPNQLVKVVENTDSQLGYVFTGVDASEFKSPFTLITNENATNYNTLDKLCHLEDGLYLCKDTYKANQDYIVDITFKGMDVIKSVGAMYGGTEPTPESTTVRCKNGCLISVSSITSIHKNIRITQSAEETNSNAHSEQLFGDIYISAKADDGTGTTENPVYGVTGDSVNYIRPFDFTSVLNTYYPAAVLSNAFGSEAQNLNGKLAKWQTSGSQVVLTGADIKESPIIEVNDSNWSNFDTLQKWFEAEPGVYYINCTPVRDSVGNIESYKTISAGFHFSDFISNQGNIITVTNGKIELPYKCLVYVISTDQSGGGWYRDLHIYFPQVSGISGTGISYGNVSTRSLDFNYSLINGAATVANVTADNVELSDGGLGAFAVASISEVMAALMPIMGYFESLKSSDIGKLVKIASPSSSDYGNEYEFQAADITLIGNSTSVTPAQVLAAVNEGKATTITHTDATHGTFKFTSFGVVSTASGDAVSSSITYGTGADSLVLHTLIGDVTKGTWTLYSKNLTFSA